VVDLEQAELRSPDPKIIRMWRGTANPGKAGHAWVKRRFITRAARRERRILVRKVKLPNGMEARLTRRFIPGTVLDNPIYANDPLYMAQLATLPEVLRNQLLYGDWNAGYGAALERTRTEPCTSCGASRCPIRGRASAPSTTASRTIGCGSASR
jgi:hypothetical protein